MEKNKYNAEYLMDLHGNANAFVEARIATVMSEVLDNLPNDGDSDELKKVVGKWLALSYACGFTDSKESRKAPKLYV